MFRWIVDNLGTILITLVLIAVVAAIIRSLRKNHRAGKTSCGCNKGVRSSDIAAALGRSKPSVHNMMKTFMDFGLVRKDAYGAAFFTPQGAETARLCRRYYEAVARLLRQGFPRMREEQTAVCALLSQIPEEELEALCRRGGGESAS